MRQARQLFCDVLPELELVLDPAADENDGGWWSVAYYLAHTPEPDSPTNQRPPEVDAAWWEKLMPPEKMADDLNKQHKEVVQRVREGGTDSDGLLKQLDAIGVLRMMLGGGGLLRATLSHRTGETFGPTKLAPQFPLAIPYWSADDLRRGLEDTLKSAVLVSGHYVISGSRRSCWEGLGTSRDLIMLTL